MGYSFTAASSQYLSVGAAVIASYPVTLVAWVKPANLTATGIAVCAGESGVDNYVEIDTAGTVAGDPARAVNRPSSGVLANAQQAGYAASTWQLLVGVFEDEDNAKVYLDGAEATDTNASGTDNSASWDEFLIGSYVGGGSFFYDGLIAEVGVYDVALNAANIGNLQTKSPLLVRASDLVEHWTLKQGDALTGTVASTALTNNNGATASADHPSIIVPGSGSSRAFFAGARMAGGRMG